MRDQSIKNLYSPRVRTDSKTVTLKLIKTFPM